MIESTPYLAFDMVWPGMPEQLAILAQHHTLTVVTLRHNRSQLLHELSLLKLDQYFSLILSDPAESQSKPDTKVQLVRNAFSGQKISGWFIGDTQTDILAGKGLNINTLAVTFGIRDASLLTPVQPDILVESSDDLIHQLQHIHNQDNP